ncbi:MAG: phosphate ABC transporter permease PstA [Phycisphaerales bacterium]
MGGPSRATVDLIARRRRMDVLFAVAGALLVVLCLGVLVLLVGDLVRDASARFDWSFFTNYPSRKPEQAGIKSPLVGTLLVMLVTGCTAIPLGVAAGVYLEEYARKNVVTNIIEINIANLAGVPSIIWGLMALGLFIYQFERWFGSPDDGVFGLGRSILTAGLTLGLLVLPIVIVATRESIRAIPQGVREASFACGASRLETVRHHVLPYSLPGVLTGCIIAMSRAIGETAPLVTIGALSYVAFLPPLPGSVLRDADGNITGHAGVFDWLHSGFTVLPIQMFNWVSRPDSRFLANAAAAGLVLLAVTLVMNGVAIVLRNRMRRNIQW